MKKIFVLFLALLLSTFTYAKVYVKGYYRKNGTYVRPYYRSSPSSSKRIKSSNSSSNYNISQKNLVKDEIDIYYENLTEDTIVYENDIFIEIPKELMPQIKFYIVKKNKKVGISEENLFLKEEKPFFLNINNKNYVILKRRN